MSNNNKANILVLMDEHNCRRVYRIEKYIFYQNFYFILITDEEQFELLRAEHNLRGDEWISAVHEEIIAISAVDQLPLPIVNLRKRYRTVGLMYTEDSKANVARSYQFKVAGDDENIDVIPYLPHIIDPNL
ncbi:hypothetical protein BK124_19070 [Paenibacillus amylolyticus]|uniref:hypothetical protein n=1 Tax=Paenibacillus amylolyticus TaxID=1451 RepID=UPI00096F4F06|nr:hypothetical protein [Paenibacillus amylolyticus]OME95806.1 hypothetical protein BK124_19070 [Paenibacillus amylolyticus]